MHRIITDLGYGDAGKGTAVDYYCSREPIRAVIRYNGGAQAAHNVVTPDGRHHTFAQFGSGSFHDGVLTHLSRYSLVDPLAMRNEAEHLISLGVTDIWDRLTVDADALITTPFHVAVNRARENARGAGRHGSCGMGIGETQYFANEFPNEVIRLADLHSWPDLRRKLMFLVGYYQNEGFSFDLGTESLDSIASHLFEAAIKINTATQWELDFLLQEGPCIFEGAQGVLLDESRGFHPYTTWSKTTPDNAVQLLKDAGVPDSEVTRVGVMRAYMTRHGAGPFVTEDDDLFSEFTELHNAHGEFQGGWRVGHLDFVALRYALEAAGGVDELFVTHLDQAESSTQLQYCAQYADEQDGWTYTDIGLTVPEEDLDAQERLTNEMLHRTLPIMESFPSPGDIVKVIERELNVPVSVVSYGPTYADKRPVLSYANGVG